MISNVMVAIKSGDDARAILGLLRSVVPTPATVHVVSLVRVGTQENEIERLEQFRQFVDGLAAQLSEEGYDAKGHADISGLSQGMDLTRLAQRLETELLIIGLRKRTRVGKALLGGDAQTLLLHATVPVLCARIN